MIFFIIVLDNGSENEVELRLLEKHIHQSAMSKLSLPLRSYHGR